MKGTNLSGVGYNYYCSFFSDLEVSRFSILKYLLDGELYNGG